MLTATRPPPFHVMTKPSGSACNLDCSYCYFLAKERLYPGSDFRMSDDVLDACIRQILEAHGPGEVEIAWQGGEPTLMGIDFFRRAIALAERYRGPGQVPRFTCQTNGILIDDRWAAFFRRHDVLVGISIDGPQALHDACRVDRGGRPTFERVMRGLDRLKAHGVDFNVLCTVHAANGDHPRAVYRFLRDEAGARHIQFIPIVEPETERASNGSPVTARSVGAAQYGDFLIAVFDDWLRRDVGTVFVQAFDVALAAWLGAPPLLCVHAPVCGLALALEHNGDLYCCDHYVDPDHRLGNILDRPMAELVGTERQRRFGRDKLDTLPQACRDCDVRFACHGGCPKDRLIATAANEDGLNYLCAGYKAFFRHVDRPMRMMASLLAQGRPAADVMTLAGGGETRRARAPGRNAPCPCGSGRKFKHCHGRS